ncbi:hAT transposon superfamily protein [Perilla frutescens var. hirtella]|uniref:HAT transposon superfamily protein n=1 Tax=Perilla frutescens var. hirtella TaxID=608512 RepID=A0AAD4INX2_PERFH|nr:hAT transposon superfamily protein [Perilla frutescens var. hirtella]
METSSLASATQSFTSEMVLKRNSDDVGWNYSMLIDAKNMDKVQCIKCGKKMSGGIYRIKQHIAQIKGSVASCTKASKEDQEICRKAINEAKLKKKRKKDEDEELRSQVNVHNDPREEAIDVDQLQESFGSMKLARNALDKQRLEVVREYMSRWAYDAGVSFNCLELDSWKLLVEAIGQYGPGFVTPTRYDYTNPLLKKEIDRTKDLLKTHEVEWKLNGCSIMTDGWSDRKRRSIMNLCVNSKLGTVFLSSKDFSNTSHTSEVIFDYVDQCIDEVGLDNVVQIVTDNASNNMGAAKLLKEKRPKIFWTSCAAHTIDLMLESIAKQSRFKKVIDQARALTVFLYAHHKVLALIRLFTKENDIVRPGVTRFASAFLTLQSIQNKRVELKAMFGSREWEECKFSKSVKGKAAYTTVVSMTFWSGVASCLQVFTPLIKVLRIADGDRKPSMGFIYGELVQAKEDIKMVENNIPKNYEPIIEVMDARIKDRLDSPLYLTAYLLNPFYHYKNPLLHLEHDISIGMIECLDILFPGDVDLQSKIMNEEFPKYRDKESIFGKPIAVKGCSLNDAKFDPGHRSPTPKYRSMRELYDDDFESEDEEINENEYEPEEDRGLDDFNV